MNNSIASRLSNLIKHHHKRPCQNSPLVIALPRFASNQPNHHAHYGPQYETHEGFGNSLFLATGAGIVGLAMYHAFAPVSSGSDTPALTRHLSNFFKSDPDQVKKIEANNMSVVLDAADKAFFKASLERPAIRRMANAGNFDIASPYGVVPGTETDLSDLRIKSYEDDLKQSTNLNASSVKA